MWPDRLDAVVFDMDGTLLDTEAMYKEAIFDACRRLGYEMTDEFHRGMIGHPRDRNRAALAEFFGPAFPVDDYSEHCAASVSARFRQGLSLRTGAMDLLRLVRSIPLPTAIATSTPRQEAIEHLTLAGLIEFFPVIVSRTDVARGKPHPDTYLRAARLLSVDPRNCVAVEDSHNGVRAAHAAGMATIMVPDMQMPTEEIRALCAAVLDSLTHLHDLLHERHAGAAPTALPLRASS